jgi:hypothetical protein
MRRVLATILLLSGICSAAVFPYPLARTDQNVTQLPNPMPTWGGAIGAGAKWCNPAFNGLCIIRITDSKNNKGSSLSTADTGGVQLATRDSRHIIVHTNGGSLVVGFSPTQETVSATLMQFNYIVQASETNAQVLYALKKTQIHKLTANLTWTTLTDQIIFDYATPGCLGTSYTPIWHGVFTIAGNPRVFKTAFSNTGGQGSGNIVVAWSAAKGCSVYDTVAGTVTNNGKLLGLVNIADRFYIHAGGAGRNPLYSTMDPTVHQPNGNGGCLTATVCASYYFWQIGTTTVNLCGLPSPNQIPYCDGHLAQLESGALSDRRYILHDWANPTTPLTSMGSLARGSGDTHQSSDNGADINGRPLFIFSQQKNSPPVYPVWGFNEIMVMAMDGSKVVGRLGQNLNSGNSKTSFVCQNAIGVSFQASKNRQAGFAMFTSDMGGGGVLGYEKDGVTPRCDVFVIETMKQRIPETRIPKPGFQNHDLRQ